MVKEIRPERSADLSNQGWLHICCCVFGYLTGANWWQFFDLRFAFSKKRKIGTLSFRGLHQG
ncbi:MAG: hypothetical protein H6677_05440 [Candidatus Obscuribacterales bacterium]|nr:hypothetical protein [Candidatus Obscuribacterales bacterium]